MVEQTYFGFYLYHQRRCNKFILPFCTIRVMNLEMFWFFDLTMHSYNPSSLECSTAGMPSAALRSTYLLLLAINAPSLYQDKLVALGETAQYVHRSLNCSPSDATMKSGEILSSRKAKSAIERKNKIKE